jgi:wyosine [tRNA(Phe)-imidazoG37] synthetase (radical SAM superfamily)
MKNNSYCSQKWWWLTVDPERRLLASCCKADQQQIDTTWLSTNPGKLFNNPTIQQERADMLAGKAVTSCAKSCWVPESQGIPSRRTLMQDKSDRVFTDVVAQPEVVELVLGSDCNMTCVYCSKRFSSAWRRDIVEHGTYIPGYTIEDRFDLTLDDRVILKLGQSDLKNSGKYQLILNEITRLGKIKTLKIMGGEPFLYNGLEDILRFVEADTIDITTGLGVNSKRFERMLGMLPPDSTQLVISAESTGKLYEFVRYGNSYENFLRNLEIVKKHKIKYKFAVAISNLNIHGFKQFQDEFATEDDYFNVLVDPVFLAPSVIDPAARDAVLATSYKYYEQEIHQSVMAEYTNEQLTHFKQFVPEFARRRDLSLDVFPETFKKWILE